MIAAFILAGGRSSRFGENKALFPVEGVPMALRVARAMQEAGLKPALIGRDPRLKDLGLPVFFEAPGDHHPLLGVRLGLQQAQEAVFAPCDLPWLPSEAFTQLLARASPCVVTCRGRPQPLLARYSRAMVPRVEGALTAGAPARCLAEGVDTLELPAAWLTNVNRLGDLVRPQDLVRHNEDGLR